MKQIIRLTESDLHRIVKESVGKILMELDFKSPGMAGNTMTAGGRFGSTNSNETVNILEDFIQKLVSEGLDDNITDAVILKCKENENLFNIEFKIDSDYDETTGYGTKDSPVTSAYPITGYIQLRQMIGNMANDPQLTKMLLRGLEDTIQDVSDKLTQTQY